MAYARHRFDENAAGMTGYGRVALYDGTGAVAAGGDLFATIVADGFFTGQEAFDAVDRAAQQTDPDDPDTRGITDGEGLSIIVQGNDKTCIDVLYRDGAELKMRGGAWRIPNGRT